MAVLTSAQKHAQLRAHANASANTCGPRTQPPVTQFMVRIPCLQGSASHGPAYERLKIKIKIAIKMNTGISSKTQRNP